MKKQAVSLTLAMLLAIIGSSAAASESSPDSAADAAPEARLQEREKRNEQSSKAAHTEDEHVAGEEHEEGENGEGAPQAEGHEEGEHEAGAEETEEHEEGGHNEEHGGEEHEPGTVEVSRESQKRTPIRVEPLTLQPVPKIIQAPGEIKLNAYQSAKVTTRIPAQITERYAKLGDTVEKGAPMALLSSVEMAEAQGKLLVTAREWERVRELGKSVVGAGRYTETQVAFEQARSKLLAYGMIESQVDQFLRKPDELKLGEYRLLAPQAGTVLEDSFILGQHVDAGESLFLVTDESSVWAEAAVSPDEAARIEPGSQARVRVEEGWLEGSVVQKQHRLNESTRTVAVRIEIPITEGHTPHAGDFVETAIVAEQGAPALLVPERALNRNAEGKWAVFVQESPEEFRLVEVERVRDLPGQAVVEGVEPGVRLVTDGAFYLNSELAKSGFSVHNH